MDLLLLVAVLPAAWLLHYVYKLDPVEKEPVRLLARLLVWGAVACFPAVLLEELGINVLMGGAPGSDIGSLLFENFIVIALSEELCKMFFLRWKTWKSPEFNYVFDGIVYAVFVSLGFAILENIGYVMEFGMATALVRAVTAIPGHAIFGVFMGVFYGLEKRASLGYRPHLRTPFAVCSLLVPVFCHGFYDFCASIDGDVFLVVFFVFLIAMVVVAARLVKYMAKMAHPLSGAGAATPGQTGYNQGEQQQANGPFMPADSYRQPPANPNEYHGGNTRY